MTSHRIINWSAQNLLVYSLVGRECSELLLNSFGGHLLFCVVVNVICPGGLIGFPSR